MEKEIKKKLIKVLKKLNNKIKIKNVKEHSKIENLLSEKKIKELNKIVNKKFKIKTIFPEYNFEISELISAINYNLKEKMNKRLSINENLMKEIDDKNLQERFDNLKEANFTKIVDLSFPIMKLIKEMDSTSKNGLSSRLIISNDSVEIFECISSFQKVGVEIDDEKLQEHFDNLKIKEENE